MSCSCYWNSQIPAGQTEDVDDSGVGLEAILGRRFEDVVGGLSDGEARQG